MSCVGSLLFISIFLILLWRHRNVGAVDSRGEICIRVERGVTVVEQSNTPKNGLRSMFLREFFSPVITCIVNLAYLQHRSYSPLLPDGA